MNGTLVNTTKHIVSDTQSLLGVLGEKQAATGFTLTVLSHTNNAKVLAKINLPFIPILKDYPVILCTFDKTRLRRINRKITT